MRNEGEQGGRLRLSEAEAGDGCLHFCRANFVQLVDLAQNQFLLFGICDAISRQQAEQQFPVAEMDREIADAQFLENLDDDGGQFGVIGGIELVLADDVDIALVEFTEPAALRPLAAIDALHLVAAEREGQLMLMLRHVAGEGDGEVEAQGQFRLMPLLQAAGALDEIDLLLGLAAGFGQQHVLDFEHRRFDRHEAEPLIAAPDDVQHVLEDHLLAREQFQGAGGGAGLNQGHSGVSIQRGRESGDTIGMTFQYKHDNSGASLHADP